MKKVFLVILGIGLFSMAAIAQRGNKISIAGDVSAPIGDFGNFSKAGYGGTVKFLYGIGRAGQLTLTSGYVTFNAKEIIKDMLGANKASQSIIPVLAGYRHNFHGLYIEPQIGYGVYASKIKGGLFESKSSDGAFSWAAGVGYVFRSVEIGVRYQNANKDDEGIGMVGFRLGYNFSF